MIVEHRWRRESAAYWADLNPTPAEGEPIFERDTGRFKLGDGETPYNDLPYFIPSGDGGSEPLPPGDLADHVNDTTPHPVYDDGPSLLLIYENAKV